MKTPGRHRGDHLIHRLAARDRTARDAETNFYCRIFSFHLQNLTVAAAVSAAELRNVSRESILNVAASLIELSTDKIDLFWC